MENGVTRQFTILFIAVGILAPILSLAQKPARNIRKGNSYYKQGKFQESIPEYKQALQQEPENPKANYNLGNATFRNQQPDEALEAYDKAYNASNEMPLKERAVYNKGVT